MAAFPSLEPIERSYDLGAHSMSVATASNGDGVRFLHGAEAVDVPVELVFPGRSLADAMAIEDHYLAQLGGRPFPIPAAVWRSHASLYDVVPATQAFIYAAPPTREARPGGLFDVSVSLLSIL
jgi:hypothetical protein